MLSNLPARDCGTFLSRFAGETVDFYIVQGNTGDALILAAAKELLAQKGVRGKFIPPRRRTHMIQLLTTSLRRLLPRKRCACISGSGNLIDLYWHCNHLLQILPSLYEQVILLPSTITGIKQEALLKKLPENVTIFCRERISAAFVARHWQFANTNAYLCHDLAFSFDYAPWQQQGKGILHAFREDSERTTIVLPEDNIDLSKVGSLQQFLAEIARHETVETNRLHVAIAAAKLGKKVHFYPGSYWKNQAVYEYSMRRQLPNVTWIGGTMNKKNAHNS
ncbi:MAG: polysaccharide pyruvyl transferase family protein [Candidatus Peribacteraceae bacterium]|nr:polysaccharide pyruvyl transferase family protein [Candidatus Peribacteraceae bacterium]